MICFLKFGERASHEDVWMILISRSSIIHLFKPSKSCPFQTIVCKSAAQQKTTALTHDESRLVILIVECRCRANYSHGRLKTTRVGILVDIGLQTIVLIIELFSKIHAFHVFWYVCLLLRYLCFLYNSIFIILVLCKLNP